MSNIRTGHSNLIPDDLAGVCGDIGLLIGAWESNVALSLMSHEGHLHPTLSQLNGSLSPSMQHWAVIRRSSRTGRNYKKVLVLTLMKEEKSSRDVRTRLHDYRGLTHTSTIWKGRRPRYSFGGRVKSSCPGNVYSGPIPTDAITSACSKVQIQG
jgi:hypothetical protein